MVRFINLFILLTITASTESYAQYVQIGNEYYYPVSQYFGQGNIVGIDYISSLPSGTVTIQEKNLCPPSYKGGTLYLIQQSLSGVVKATLINGEIYLQWGGSIPEGVSIHRTGSYIFTSPPPLPSLGQAVTYNNLTIPALHVYSMGCYYNNNCEELGPNVNSCVWNAPAYLVGINMAPIKMNLSVSADPGNFFVAPSETTIDGSISVKPNVPTQVLVKVSGTDITNQETQSAIVTLKVGNRSPIQQSVPLSLIKANGSYLVPFDVTFTAEEAGKTDLVVSVNSGGTLEESDLSDNLATQSIYTLCNVADKGTVVPYFAQGGTSPWANDDYGPLAPQKMKKLGCYTTSFAMLLRAYGITTSADGFSPIDPGSVNAGLNLIGYYKELGPNYATYNGYTPRPSGAVHPIGAVNFARASYAKNCITSGGVPSACHQKALGKISYIDRKDIFDSSVQKKLNKELCEGNPVILKVPSISHPDDPQKMHFVLAKGFVLDESGQIGYITNDPANRLGGGNGQIYSLNKIRGYRLYKQTSDPSMISIHLIGGLNMVITDSMGNKSGYDPYTEQFYNSIPNATYTLPESIDSPDNDNISTALEATFESVNTPDGEYHIQIFGDPNTSSEYRLVRYGFDIKGTINAISDKSGEVSAGQVIQTKVSHLSASIPVRYANLKISKALFFDSRRKDKAFISGRISPEDGRAISKIDKLVTVRVGSFTKSIELKKLKRLKIFRTNYYFYIDWRRKGLAFEINADTGQFSIYIDNFDLDDSKPSLTTNIEIQIDDLQAENTVTFKDIKRRKHGK